MNRLQDGAELSLRKNVIWNTVGSVFYQGCMWLLTILVVRLSTDYQNSGMLAFAMSVGNIFFVMGTYNMRTFQVSDVNGVYSTKNYVALRVLTVTLSYALCLFYSTLITPNAQTLLTVVVYLLFKADEAFVNVLYGTDQTYMRLDYVGKSQILRGSLCVALFTIGMLTLNNLISSLFLMFIGCLTTTFVYDMRKAHMLAGPLAPAITRKQCSTLLLQCFPAAFGILIGNFVMSSARQYFGVAYGESALGIYASVATPCVIIQVLAQNVYTPMLGPIASEYRTGSTRRAKYSALKLLVLVAGAALILSAILLIAGEPLLTTLYGESIRPYVGVLPLALVVTTGAAETILLSDLLIVFSGLKSTLIMNVIAFTVNLAFIVPCTAEWYMNGINISLIAAYFVAILFGIASIVKIKDRTHRRTSRVDGTNYQQ